VNLENLSDLQEGLLSEVGRENAEVCFQLRFFCKHFMFEQQWLQLKRIWEIPSEELEFERLIDRGAYGDVRSILFGKLLVIQTKFDFLVRRTDLAGAMGRAQRCGEAAELNAPAL
jgi:hypothetical protein